MTSTPPKDKEIRPMDRSITDSLCPVCLKRIAAKRVQKGTDTYLEKNCPEHGSFKVLIWRGAPVFDSWQRPKIPVSPPVLFSTHQKGCPFDCGLCPGHHQRSCTILIEVTQRCDLACPVCYAAAPSAGADPSLEALSGYFEKAWQAGPTSNIQLSGGEPTLRDDLPEIVALGVRRGFGFIQVNTNGLRLACDSAYVRALREAGLSSVFLQFDGIEENTHRCLRGRAMAAEKRAAIDACEQNGIGVVLVPTLVPGVNTHEVGAIVDFALGRVPTVRGVHFQPVSYFGRYMAPPMDGDRLTLPDLMRALEDQTGGKVKISDFKPPGCENALCSFHGHYLAQPDRRLMPLLPSFEASPCCGEPIRADIGAQNATAYVARQWAGTDPEPLLKKGDASCRPPDSEKPVASGIMSLDAFLHQARTRTFSISAMAFQDVWNLTLDRVQDCCIHVMAPDGRLVPFCLYNLTAASGAKLYRP